MKRSNEQLIDQLTNDLTPVRPMNFSQGALMVLLAALSTIALVALVHGFWRGLLSSASTWYFVTQAALGLAAAASAGAAVRLAMPRVGSALRGFLIGTGTLVILPATAIITLSPSGQLGHVLADPYGASCAVSGFVFGLITAAALIYWLRRGAPVRQHLAGTLTGIASGAMGMFAYGLHCPLDTLGHLGIWHFLPVVVSGLLGRWLVPLVIRW